MIDPPPLDENGNVLKHDHEQILNDSYIIRRISEQQIVIDGNGRKVISSIAYNGSSDPENGGMSIDLLLLMESDGIDPHKWVTTPRWIGSVLFKVADVRSLEFMVGYNPLPENKYHGEVWGNFSRSVRKKLQKLADWFVQIDGVYLE